MKKYMRGFSFYALLFIILVFVIFLSSTSNVSDSDYSHLDLKNDLTEGRVLEIDVKKNSEIPTGVATIQRIDETGTTATTTLYVSNTQEFIDMVLETDITQKVDVFEDDVERANFLMSLLPSIIILIAVVFLLIFIMNQAQGGGGGSRVMSFGKSRAKMVVDDEKKVTFANVAGLKEEKEELEEVVEFLKSPKKFVDLGARIPKGVVLIGPPGTGKTLLAKAVSGEAGVPFYTISGSDFVEMFVGVGASRVRDLFEQAKKNAPCIVFIDEIDAVGRKRGAGLGGGHDEREQTLNQLLVEMDGFGINEGVIVIAATNRVDILDPALLRPGRFDRKVYVGKPDVEGREQILKVHSKDKPLSDDINLDEVARTTAGFTGADLENLVNEAAIYAARDNKKVIEQSDMRRAFIKVGIGTEKRSRIISEKEKKITAYHEAGHAIIFHVLDEIDDVHSISIIPTGMAGGYTMPLPSRDEMYLTKKKMEQSIVSLLGGRAAEELVLDDVTTGASNDIERATGIARNMVIRYGMSDVLGPIQYGGDNDEVFIGRDWGHTRNYGENIAGIIDGEIKRIVGDSYEKAKELLEENMQVLHKTAALLIEKEKITGHQFFKLFGNDNDDEPDEGELGFSL